MTSWIRTLRFSGARGVISLAAVVAVAAAMSGCAATAKQGTGQGSSARLHVAAAAGSGHVAPAPSGRPLPLPVQKVMPRGDLLVLTGGRLTFDGTCFYLNGHGSNLVESLVWPSGYSARNSPPRILDPHGNVVARAGQAIELGGSLVPITWGARVLHNVLNAQCTAGAKEILLISGTPKAGLRAASTR